MIENGVVSSYPDVGDTITVPTIGAGLTFTCTWAKFEMVESDVNVAVHLKIKVPEDIYWVLNTRDLS